MSLRRRPDGGQVSNQPPFLELDEYPGQSLNAQRQIAGDNTALQRVGNDVLRFPRSCCHGESDKERRHALNWVSLTRLD